MVRKKIILILQKVRNYININIFSEYKILIIQIVRNIIILILQWVKIFFIFFDSIEKILNLNQMNKTYFSREEKINEKKKIIY